MSSHTRYALVTGANKGIGFAVARQLGRRGYYVWLGCRDEARAQQAADTLRSEGIAAGPLVFNTTKEDEISAAVQKMQTETSTLDILVNNAGMHFGVPPAPSKESIDDIRSIFETNVFGNIMVTQHFLPFLRRSSNARIVFCSSGLGSIGETLDVRSESWGIGFLGYCASKAALNMIMAKFAKELINEGIKVNAADPGMTSTDMTGNSMGHSPDFAARALVELATLDVLGPSCGFYKMGVSDELKLIPW